MRSPEERRKRSPTPRPAVTPWYGTPEDHVRNPHETVPQTRYFVRYWMPRLGPVLSSIIQVLREEANSAQTGGWASCGLTQEEIARRIGVKSRHTVMNALAKPIAQLFIHRIPCWRVDPRTGRKVRAPDRYMVRMDDPVVEEHEGELVVRTAERILSMSEFSTEIIGKTLGTSKGLKSKFSTVDVGKPSGRSASKISTAAVGQSTEKESNADSVATQRSQLSKINTPKSWRENQQQSVADSEDLISAMERIGLDRASAARLLEEWGPERIRRQLELHGRRTGLVNPPGAFVEAVRRDWPAPAEPVQGDHERYLASESRRRLDELARIERRRLHLREIFERLPEERRNDLMARARESAAREWPSEIPLPEAFVRARLYAMLEAELGGDENPSGVAGERMELPAGIPIPELARRFAEWFQRSYGIAFQAGSRMPEQVRARRIAWLVLRGWSPPVSYHAIGRLFGCDPSTVLDGVRVASGDADLRKEAEQWSRRFAEALAESLRLAYGIPRD